MVIIGASGQGVVAQPIITLPPSADRRWSRIMRMACSRAIEAINHSGDARIDAIYWGTGIGCLEDTEKFLNEIHTVRDAPLSPTPFMRSTHNTMAGQLAMVLGARGANITFSQGFLSFHLAMLHARLHLADRPDHRVLVGAADERSPVLEKIVHALQRDRNMDGDPAEQVAEGASAFVIAGANAEGAFARIMGTWIGCAADERTWVERIDAVGVDRSSIGHALIGADIATGMRPWIPKGANVIDYRERTGLHQSAPAQAVEQALTLFTEPSSARHVLVADRVGSREAALLLERC